MQIADSFPSDPFSQAPQQQTTKPQPAMALKKPPKWLRRPVGANFGVSKDIFNDMNLYIHRAINSARYIRVYCEKKITLLVATQFHENEKTNTVYM